MIINIIVGMIITRRLWSAIQSFILGPLARRDDAIEQNVFQLTPNRGLRTLRREMMPWCPVNLHTKGQVPLPNEWVVGHQPVEILSSFIIIVDKRAGGHIATVQQ
jgi:hypothetical protein